MVQQNKTWAHARQAGMGPKHFEVVGYKEASRPCIDGRDARATRWLQATHTYFNGKLTVRRRKLEDFNMSAI